jgi:hypothetical protein
MKLYDLLKEYGLSANDIKSRLDLNLIKVNGKIVDRSFDINTPVKVFDQGFFISKLCNNFSKFIPQIKFFGIENLINSNIENNLTKFLNKHKLIRISKNDCIIIECLAENKNKFTTTFIVEGGKFKKDFEFTVKSDDEILNKLLIDKSKLEKQLSNPGFLNNAPQFKIDSAKKRLENITKKISELNS